MKLLNIQKEIPDILLEIRYCTTYNFIGEIIDGYIDPVALGTKELVEQLKIINSKARQMGYRLKIWDAYRPQSALDMGSYFDYFGDISSPLYTKGLTNHQINNRMTLRNLMLDNGFIPLESEWWHYTLKDEPYPDTYFNEEVKCDGN